MFLPVLAALAVAQNVNPLLYMVPATMSASMAFMMPVATPPNAIVFGSQRLHIIDMARVGLVINLIGVAVTTIAAHALLPLVFGTEPGVVPPWAQ
jgi:sodium-dependent dicarboxylate transporter 2/3/5